MTDQPFAECLAALDPGGDEYATQFVDLLLNEARRVRASDLHLHPTGEGLDVRWRIDGVLSALGTFPKGDRTDPIARLKVLSGLLTYKQDLPQEGRIRDSAPGVEMRVSTFPSLHGERAVVRIVADTTEPWTLSNLGLPDEQVQSLRTILGSTSASLLITGPTGSGKTTTAYAGLREIVATSVSQRSISTLEDPIESALDGVAQSQVNGAAGFTMPVGLRSLLRQDPEVILVGEIRDQETATVALQAALTGQFVVSTFHAASACAALSRLADMGIERYVLRTGIAAVMNQRLFRKLCACAKGAEGDRRLGFTEGNIKVAVGCKECHKTGYRGRFVIGELLLPEKMLAGERWETMEAAGLQRAATTAGMVTLSEQAKAAVVRGRTSPQELVRVLGTVEP